MKKYFLLFALLGMIAVLPMSSCKKSTPGNEVVTPDPDPDPDPQPQPGKRNVIVWVDARANVFGTYGRLNDTAEISKILDTLKNVGVTGIVLDLKGSSGYTMYPSSYATQVTSQDGKTITPGIDYAQFFISSARQRNLKVYASIITFVEGDGARGIGNVFEDPVFKNEYQSVAVDASGNRVPITSTGKNGFVNPAISAVQERVLNIIKEIVQNYDVDGLILDYARYADINTDFSDFSKQDFIKFLEEKYSDANAKYMNFPADIVSSWRNNNGQIVPNTQGTYYKKWLLYRSKVIYDFFVKARQAVKSVKPNVDFGVYVGAWYATYYQMGVNWASQDYDPFNDPELRFDWAYPEYNKTGYAEQLDLLMTGNYFTQLMINDNPASAGMKYHWWSVEGSIKGTKYITRNKVELYGSMDLGNIAWPNKEAISRTMKYILDNTSGGLMLFDLCHIYAPQYNMLKQPLWDAVSEGLK